MQQSHKGSIKQKAPAVKWKVFKIAQNPRKKNVSRQLSKEAKSCGLAKNETHSL